MRTRRTKEQIRKDIYNKDVDAYNFYVVNLDTMRAETGFQFKEDAVDLLNDYDDKKKYKVVSKRALKTMGVENPNESFKYEAGGNFQAGVYAGGGEVRRFNRHEQMDSETREELLDVISDPDLSGYLTNCLYGLFDGYDYSQTEYFKKDMSKLKSKDSKLYNRVVDIYKKIDKYKFEKYDEYAKGGSLEAHGIQQGDTFVKTVSGSIQKVKDKNGKIFYINLSTGERDAQPPLPFENGGKVSEDLFENYNKQPKKLAEIVENYMSKFEEGDYDYQDSKNFLKEVEAVGYTFDYGLDNEPYGLRPIGTKLKEYAKGGDLGIEEEIDLTDDKVLRVRKPAMPEKMLTRKEWAEKHNASAYEYMAMGGSLPIGSINALSDLWFAVQQKDTDDYKMIANQLDKLNVPYAIQNEVSANAETQRGRKALNIPEVHERITRIVKRNERKFATGGALVGNQKRIDMNKNGKIDAEDFKLLRSSMNGAWRNERKHVNHNEDYEVRYARKTKSGRTGYKGKTNFANGGGLSKFEKLSNRVAKNYEGKRVKPQYQKEYGKVYSKSEAKEVGDKVAGKVKASQKMATGGETKKGGQGGIMVLAKKIRKDGESWQDALKRAGQQLK